jgi:hypothetical protein
MSWTPQQALETGSPRQPGGYHTDFSSVKQSYRNVDTETVSFSTKASALLKRPIACSVVKDAPSPYSGCAAGWNLDHTLILTTPRTQTL